MTIYKIITAVNSGKEINNQSYQPLSADAERRYAAKCNRQSDTILGVLIIFSGFIFLLNNIGVFPFNIWDFVSIFWPLFSIFIGVRIIYGKSFLSDFILLVIIMMVIGIILICGLQKNRPAVGLINYIGLNNL